ncbi:MAG: His/Gly/Thr/Pro-type tRNA ligase C-terminal domain-containing protein, partial [Planctomycetota bacterium]|jgi:threonyl-tRNA synthetase
MPQRFELTYVDEDNTEKTPVMIHRAVLGSFERFLGILIEHYAAAMPAWLAPEQVRVLPISEKTNDYARRLRQSLTDASLRCSADLSDEKVGAKVAKSHAEKVPYMLVVGPREAESGTVSLRTRGSNQTQSMPVDEFLARVTRTIADKDTNAAM